MIQDSVFFEKVNGLIENLKDIQKTLTNEENNLINKFFNTSVKESIKNKSETIEKLIRTQYNV